MCRHVAYWGSPTSLAPLTLEGPRALITQCSAAREMAWGQDNLDGWGFAWLDGDGRPHRYRSGLPMTGDPNGRDRLGSIVSSHFLTHVRQKTPGSLTDPSNTAPFWDGGTRFFSHNGFVPDFRDGVREQLLGKVAPGRLDAIQGDTDSELLFALVLSRLDDGASPAEAVRAVADVGALYGGRYNVLYWGDGAMVATRWENSLYVRDGDSVVITSEPLDDGPWREVPERTMVIVNDAGVRQEDL
jgi:gamma-glutamyl hercynylcysteine S-oxide hydrolase